MNDHYIGAELEIFAAASNWKTYIAQKIGQFIHGRVLEVGPGSAPTRGCYTALAFANGPASNLILNSPVKSRGGGNAATCRGAVAS